MTVTSKSMDETLCEIIRLVSAKIEGKRRYLAICAQTILTETPPTFTPLTWYFRQVLSVNGQSQPWCWQRRPYFAAAAGHLLFFPKSTTRCAHCGRTRVMGGYRDASNRVTCLGCPIEFPVPTLPINPLRLRHEGRDLALYGMPTCVWPDAFPVMQFRDLIKQDLDPTEDLHEDDGRDLVDLAAPSWLHPSCWVRAW